MKTYNFTVLPGLNNDITTIFNDKIWDRYRACKDGIADYAKLDMEAIMNTKSSLTGKEPLYVHIQWGSIAGQPVKYMMNCDDNVNLLIHLN